MIKWFKKNREENPSVENIESSLDDNKICEDEQQSSPTLASKESTQAGFYTRLKQGLSKTRQQLGGLSRLLMGHKEIDAPLLEELETLLIRADIGVGTVQTILQQVKDGLARRHLSDGKMVFEAIKTYLENLLLPLAQPLKLDTEDGSVLVILVVGVNGAGKTTTIGKLAKQFQQQGKKVMLAAGDTFRAAAIDQLQTWGARNEIPVIAQQIGADSASVVYDALQSAKARAYDVLIADTAGRLHTQNNLLEELKKIKRVLHKLDPNAPHETMLVLDASIGQNALNQVRDFHQAVGLTGITMTKLDGTAKGGILFAIAKELAIPFRYLGIGEGIDDLRLFNASQFVEAIFDDD